MADPLSIAASIVGITAAGFQVSSALLKFAGDVGSAAKDARQLGTDISCLCTILQVLATTMQEADAIHVLEFEGLSKKMTKSCRDIFHEINSLVEELQSYTSLAGETAPKLAKIIKLAFQKSRIVYLRTSLDSYKSTLNLWLSTLDFVRRVAKRRTSTSSIVDITSDLQQEHRIQNLELAQRASIAELQELEDEANSLSTVEGIEGQRLSWASERNSQWLSDEQLSLRRWSSHLIDAQDTALASEVTNMHADSRRSRRMTQIFDGTIQAAPSPIIQESQVPRHYYYSPQSWDPAGFDEENLKTIEVVRSWLNTLSAADRLKAWGGLLPSGYGIRCQDGPDSSTTPLFSVHESLPSPLHRLSSPESCPCVLQVPRIASEASNEKSRITTVAAQSTSTPKDRNPEKEFKAFRISVDDPCHKVLPVALKKWGITADWKKYALYIVHGDQERCLSLNERPLILFKQLDREGRHPMFMLRKHAPPMEGHSSTINPVTYQRRGGQTLVPGGVI